MKAPNPNQFRDALASLHGSLEISKSSQWEDIPPALRHHRLAESCRRLSLEYNDDGVTDLVNSTLADTSCVAISAFEYASEQTPTPALAAINSTGLLTTARLTPKVQSRFKKTHTYQQWRIDIYHPGVLKTDRIIPEVTFIPEILDRILGLEVPGRGCPALGRVMERFYQAYVECVFGPELAAENQVALTTI